jgi:hypothetical protein
MKTATSLLCYHVAAPIQQTNYCCTVQSEAQYFARAAAPAGPPVNVVPRCDAQLVIRHSLEEGLGILGAAQTWGQQGTAAAAAATKSAPLWSL